MSIASKLYARLRITIYAIDVLSTLTAPIRDGKRSISVSEVVPIIQYNIVEIILITYL
jgi:hypothetical protein